MKAVLHESGSTIYHKSKPPFQERLQKLMKKKAEKKANKIKKRFSDELH